MKNLFLLLLFTPLFIQAQKTHTVAPKETIYAISRLYNLTPKELAAFNDISPNAGLNIGQVLKIPGKKSNAPVSPSSAKNEAPLKLPAKTATAKSAGSVPVYHKVQKKETLFQISRKYNQVALSDLKKWNSLRSDDLKEGMNLIVGYKKEINKIPEPIAVEPVQKPAPVLETEVKKVTPVMEEKIPENLPEPVKKTETVQAMVTKEPKPQTSPVAVKNHNGGFFRSQYTASETAKEESGMAGIFKSTSGWEDGKYYCLHNSAAAGSIIKITNKINQKEVYAKVLDVIPDLKQNEGVLIRLSNAAADELGAGAENFEVIINY
jgi:LysM repeat protein